MTKTNVVKLPERKDEDTGQAVANFVRDHPAIVVAGGVALGLIAGGLLSRGGILSRGNGRKLARQALTLAEVAGTAGLAFGRQAKERAGDAGEALAEQAGKLKGPAEDAVDHASEAAHRLLRKAVELAGKLRG